MVASLVTGTLSGQDSQDSTPLSRNYIDDIDVIVVGSGFGGTWLLYRLRNAGFTAKIYEAGGDVGGVWWWNHYPGSRVDSHVPYYQFSLEELWREWNWTEKFPSQAEVKNYFDFVDKRLAISKDCRFNTRVTAAEFDHTLDRWIVTTKDGRVGRAKYLVPALGYASKTYTPYIKGLETFDGPCFHSVDWPKGLDVKGKRVGVVGTGSTGVQIIQELGPQVEHLTVFQRHYATALPLRQKKLTVMEQTKGKEGYAKIFAERRLDRGGLSYAYIAKNTLDVPEEEREAFYESLWQQGGFALSLGNYQDVVLNPEANHAVYEFWKEKVRARLVNPDMQEKLGKVFELMRSLACAEGFWMLTTALIAPEKPVYHFGTKRPPLEHNYYEVFNQQNVDLISLLQDPILEVTSEGVVTRSGLKKLDVLVLATGFDAVTGGILDIKFTGLDGKTTLKDKWAKGILTYLGMTTAGYPNLIFPYGPQAPTSTCNGPSCAEFQGDWIVQLLEYMRNHGKSRIDATKEAEKEWREHVLEIGSSSLRSTTPSWVFGANIPGKVVEPLIYLGGLPRYLARCDEVANKGYEGFVLNSSV